MAIDSGDGAAQPPQTTPQQQQRQPQVRRASMTEDEQKERRASIQAIMKDPGLTPQERRKSVQALMDGRRRSSTASLGGGGGMAAAAAAAAGAAVARPRPSRAATSPQKIGAACPSLEKKSDFLNVFGRFGSFRALSSVFERFRTFLKKLQTLTRCYRP